MDNNTSIPIGLVEETALELMKRAAIHIPDDYRNGIAEVAAKETGLGAFVLKSMQENWNVADQDARPMCADSGLPRWYVKAGNEVRIEGGFVALERSLRRATAEGTNTIPLRPNRVHPITRKDNNSNIGVHAPEIDYSFEPGGAWIDLISVHKGGLFGTDYRMLFPSDGLDGIKRFFLDVMISFGRRGLACQPVVAGVGLGGSKDTCMVIGKQAACLRMVGDRNPDPEIAKLEMELMDLGNQTGIGPMGFAGKTMVLDCHVEIAYTHTGGMPMSVHCFCLAARRACARIHADGRVEYRSDPQWFTDYYRRETVDYE